MAFFVLVKALQYEPLLNTGIHRPVLNNLDFEQDPHGMFDEQVFRME
jgi:hypothetical protein